MGSKVDPRVRDAQFDAFKAKTALDEKIFHETIKNKSLLGKAAYYGSNVQGLSRSLMTGFDLSAVRRQGGLLFHGNPIRSLRIMGDMFRAARSDKDYFKLMQDIRERPNAQMYVTSKLGITDVKSPKMSALEEAYMSQWADKIPLLNHSQRAYVYFLNRLRADTFDTMAEKLGRNGIVTEAQAKEVSNFINVFTGRGHIPEQAAGAIASMNNIFFAPRYVMSRFQALTLQPLRYAHDPAVRKLIAAEYAKTLIGYGVMYGLIGMGAKQLGATVETDPRSTDFGKVKIGNTRWDFLAGLAQPTVFMARLLSGKEKNAKGQLTDIYGSKHPVAQQDVDSLLVQMFRSKLAPMPAAAWNVAKGKKVTGEPTTLPKEVRDLVTPLSGNDLYNALREQGAVKGTALGLMAVFGDSVNTYSPRVHPRVRQVHRTRPK
jgi:hypothetical protein